MKTPYFLISEKKLDKNIFAFQQALNNYWPYSQIAYSVKTNSLPWLLSYLNKREIYAEVVSDEEYLLSKMCGFNDGNIVFNGPIKSREQLAAAIQNGAIVNLDSKNDVNTVLQQQFDCIDNIGIRVNVAPSAFVSEDIAYVQDGFRFGFSDESGELAFVIEQLRKKYGNSRFGLHLHCNSVSRSLAVYRSLAKSAAKIIEKYKLSPSFLDIGGGFFGGVEGKPTASQYVSAITDELKNTIDLSKTKLIIEPGSAIIGSAVDLVTSVIDVKDTACSRIVTTDGSRIHIDPLWAKKNYKYSIRQAVSSANRIGKQVICGYTCMDHDRLMEIENQPELCIGDQIVYHRVGAYSITFGGAFIRYFPEVYAERNNGKQFLIRSKMTTEEYFKIHSV